MGVSSRVALALALLLAAPVAVSAAPAAAQGAAQEEGGEGAGAEAFARRDFAAAAALWREEAAAGSARAKLGLGLIADLGLGVPRDPARALRWYLEAAEDGLTEAQFNVGVMLDSGAGVARDPAAASVWYGRAAANGHRRAQYNLGLLYEAGDGAPRNPDLARHWLGLAAGELDAARERLAEVAPTDPEERGMAPPEVLADALVAEGGARRAELVWAAPPGPEGATFLVEVLALDEAGEGGGRALVTQETEGSALAVGLPADDVPHAWRVSRVARGGTGPARYEASPWRRLGGEGDAARLPQGRVVLRLGAEDAPALRFAREIERSLAAAGLWVRTERVADAPAESVVRYAFEGDRDLAEGIAEFLPVLTREDAEAAADLDAAPGEVVVWLVGGPDEA